MRWRRAWNEFRGVAEDGVRHECLYLLTPAQLGEEVADIGQWLPRWMRAGRRDRRPAVLRRGTRADLEPHRPQTEQGLGLGRRPCRGPRSAVTAAHGRAPARPAPLPGGAEDLCSTGASCRLHASQPAGRAPLAPGSPSTRPHGPTGDQQWSSRADRRPTHAHIPRSRSRSRSSDGLSGPIKIDGGSGFNRGEARAGAAPPRWRARTARSVR